MSQSEYAGDLSPAQAWTLLQTEAGTRLVDVRTRPEWQFVGVPDLSAVGGEVTFLSWQTYPAMELNPSFVDELRATGATPDAPLLFLCRSGVRSKAAAIAATAAGFRRCYNIAGGFEGGFDDARHRGRVAGWKVAELPWKQE